MTATFEDGTALPRTGVVLPDRPSLDDEAVLDLAVAADGAGVGSVWCWDGWGYNPFVTLARIAERTDVALGTGIANVYAYTPATAAMNALTLHDATDGRFVLGLGASTPTLVEGLHGESFERPVRRLHETVEVVRRALSGDPVEYDGELFDLDCFPLIHADREVPVLNAAIGPVNAAMTVEYADGIMPNLLPFDAIDDAVAAAAERAGVEASTHVAPHVPTCAHEDADEARRMAATTIALHVGDVDYYRDVMARHGFEEATEVVREAWSSGDRSAAVEAVPDRLIDAVTVAGTPEQVREGVADLLDGPADTVISTFPGTADEAVIRDTIDAVGTVEW